MNNFYRIAKQIAVFYSGFSCQFAIFHRYAAKWNSLNPEVAISVVDDAILWSLGKTFARVNERKFHFRLKPMF